MRRQDCADERNRPQAEHDFDFTEKVEHFGGDARTRRQAGGDLPGVVPGLGAARGFDKTAGQERVNDGQKKDQGRNGIDRIALDSRSKDVEERLAGNDGITAQAPGKIEYCIAHRLCDYRRE